MNLNQLATNYLNSSLRYNVDVYDNVLVYIPNLWLASGAMKISFSGRGSTPALARKDFIEQLKSHNGRFIHDDKIIDLSVVIDSIEE